MTDLSHIRNFSIVAHIDHGKSTLADRLIQSTNTVSARDMKEQLLDSMDIERERGITIKANTVRIDYTAENGKAYVLNLIDTPGHVDFAYEVSRSMRAVEGSLLVVDSTQGVEAQTLANVYHALDAGHEIVPVLNKIDLPASECDQVAAQIEDVIGLDASGAIRVSAKTGVGIKETLEAIVHLLPAPQGERDAPLKAMLVDSWYDSYLGVIVLVRIIDGTMKKNDRIRFMSNGTVHQIDKIGVFRPKMQDVEVLGPGEIGFITASIKQVRDTRVGDTVTSEKKGCDTALPGFKPAQPVVFCGLFPVDSSQFEDLRDAIEKLALNDASFSFEMETSAALGFGFRCGFLGLLHLEVIRDRIEREYDIDLITTAPSVVYHLYMRDGEMRELHNPADMPDLTHVDHLEEPRIKATILVPDDYLGDVLKLCQDRRGVQRATEYLSQTRAMITYDLPLAEVIYDLHDKLKSATRGYGTMDYEIIGYEAAELVRMDILVNGKRVDALSVICDRRDAERRGRAVVKKLKSELDRHMFEIAVQAAIGTRVIARETVPAMRKNVTAKCYGGDISRKRKLWAKQREGKKRMKSIGSVDIPQKAFMAVLESGNPE
jgi:GTP-binding protein LepA